MMLQRIPAQSASSCTASVLLVENDPALRRQLSLYLYDCGCAVEIASSASQAAGRLAERSFDLAFVGGSDPGAAQDWILQLRASASQPDLPVVAIAAPSPSGGAGIGNTAPDAGPGLLLVPPVSAEQVRNAVVVTQLVSRRAAA